MKTALALLILGGCLGFGAGSKAFNKGESAEKTGELEDAHRFYKEALAAEPQNDKYKRALESVAKELSVEHREQAKAREKAEDWDGASKAWTRALEFAPGEKEYEVRRDLSSLKARNLGPDEWYDGVRAIAEAHPESNIVERSLAGARAAAYQYNVNLAEQYLGSGDGARAFTYFDRAKAIDPTTPGMRPDSYAKAEALRIAAEAGQKLDAGDAVGAYELYQQAYARMPLPEIKQSMTRAKTKASAILTKLESARAKVQRGQYAEALRIYGSILDMEGAPAFIEEEATKVRSDLIGSLAGLAKSDAEKRRIPQAHKQLVDTIAYANLGRVEGDTFKASIDHAKEGRVKTALDVLDKVGLPPSSDLYAAARALAVAAAVQQLDKARSLAKRDSKRALDILSELAPLEEEVPGIKELRRQLRAGSFQDLLDEALTEAKGGNDAEAATLLLAALNASAAPESMREPATKACDELRAGQYAASEQSFTRALSTEPRSRLAQRGIDIARIRRKTGEKDALSVLETGRGDQERAVFVLEAALGVEPSSVSAEKGASLALARIKKDPAMSDADAAKLLGYAARLSLLSGGAKRAVDDGIAKLQMGDHAGAERAFGVADSNEVGKAGLEVARTRMLASLSSGAKSAAEGDEGAAKSLAALLAKDPSNAEAKKAVKSMLEKARQHASKQDDAEAARFLSLATIATNPAPGVKVHLEKGNSALAKGDVAVAEKSYAEALELEPENDLAETGHGIAKGARVGMLEGAMADAKKTGNVERVGAELRKTLELDPQGPEARRAFDELLSLAKGQAEEGNDAQAAALLDAANVVSKPVASQQKIAGAIDQIRKGDHAKAEQTFDEVLKTAQSKVAEAGRGISQIRRKSTLVADAKKLETGEDLTRGAMAVSKLLAIDPVDAAASAAIAATLSRAEKAAVAGDDRVAARELRAASIAVGEEQEAKKAIQKLETGHHQDAEDAFGYSSASLVAKKGQELAKGRRMGSLKEGLSGEGDQAALAIRALLSADPNNIEAKKAFEKLLEDARQAGKKGDDKAAGEKLRLANLAAAATPEITTAVETAAAHLSESRHAEAEKAFTSVESKAGKVGFEVAKQRRLQIERDATLAIAKPGDPRPHATQLKASLIVEPASKTVAKALDGLMDRAKKSAVKGQDVETAQILEALAILENGPSEVFVELTKASALYAQGAFEEAEGAFGSANGETDGSKIAALGKDLSRRRRITLLEVEWKDAQKAKDVLKESASVQKILALDASHTQAKAAEKRLGKQVGTSRLDSAKSNREMGKLGVAFVYLERALAMNDQDSAARSEMEAVRKQLEERLDLILLVEAVSRSKEIGGSVCLGFDEMLREEIMSDASKRTDLGAFVLSSGWTKAVEEKSDKAPEVSGGITIALEKCATTPATGKVTFGWSVIVPRGGNVAARAEVSAELTSGIIPREEQDEASNNAKMALADRAATAFMESFEKQRDPIDIWLLALGEHAVSKGDVALAADAYARLSIKRPSSIDPERMKQVEAYLEKELR